MTARELVHAALIGRVQCAPHEPHPDAAANAPGLRHDWLCDDVTDTIAKALSTGRPGIFVEINAERDRQDAKYPNCVSLPDGTGGDRNRMLEALAREQCDRADRDGRLTHSHIFDEEASEVLAETDPAKLRVELLQVAAVCVKWVEDLDRRSRPAGAP